MSSTGRERPESKVILRVRSWEFEVRGPPHKKRRRHRGGEWWVGLRLLALVIAVLVAWRIDPRAVLALLAFLYLVSNLLEQLHS
jgi:hypothetical protein